LRLSQLLAAAAIPLFYVPALFFGSRIHFAIVDMWRFRIAHLWLAGLPRLFEWFCLPGDVVFILFGAVPVVLAVSSPMSISGGIDERQKRCRPNHRRQWQPTLEPPFADHAFSEWVFGPVHRQSHIVAAGKAASAAPRE